MATATNTDYFGSTLAGLITANAAAIGTDLGLTSGQTADPDKMLAAIIVKTKAWLAADGTTNNGTEISGFGTNGASTKVVGTGDRSTQLGYQDQITFYVPDLNAATIDPADVI